jgi:hypothetical protein
VRLRERRKVAPNLSTGQTISFGSAIAGVRSVRFDVEAVESSTTFTGLAEVAFNAVAVDAVPAPPTLVLGVGGVLGFLGYARSRRRA